jgi:hypothetical protein
MSVYPYFQRIMNLDAQMAVSPFMPGFSHW